MKPININWEKVVSVFNSISTTSVRVFFTLFVIAWTAWDYIYHNDPPPESWLIFLATLAGVDMVQAAVKSTNVSKVRVQELTANKETAVKSLELEHKRIETELAKVKENTTTTTEEEKG